MKHINEYDEQSLKDLQNLDLAEKNYGWWVIMVDRAAREAPRYMAVIEKDLNAAAYAILEWHDPFSYAEEDDKEERIDTFSQLEKLFTHHHEEMINVFGWEMKPKTNDIRKRGIYDLDYNDSFNPEKILTFGKKHFSNFLEVLGKKPLGDE